MAFSGKYHTRLHDDRPIIGYLSTGYAFADANAVSPYLEEPETGPTSQFCLQLARRLHCHVVAGYPERLTPQEPRKPVLDQTPYEMVTEEVGANSAVLYGPNGELLGNYRKTNPFETDMTWAKPGQQTWLRAPSLASLRPDRRHWICGVPLTAPFAYHGSWHMYGSQ